MRHFITCQDPCALRTTVRIGLNFLEYSDIPENQEKFFRISSSLQWFLFEMCVTTIAKLRSLFFSHDFANFFKTLRELSED